LQFQEQEKKRYMQEERRFEVKHQKQLEELRATRESAIKWVVGLNVCISRYLLYTHCRELEQLQNEKRRALVEHEQSKLSEIDERLKGELREWREQLVPRKQVCMPHPHSRSAKELSQPIALRLISLVLCVLLNVQSRSTRL